MSTDTAVFANSSSASRSNWLWHVSTLAVLLVLIVVSFWFEVAQAVETWWIYPTYSHCFLIAPISGWLVWEKRHELARMTPSLAPWALFAALPLLVVWLAAKIATINEVRQFVVVALMQIAILSLVGLRVYRAILFPALYLFFLVPFGQYFIPPMQQFATWFTDHGLSAIGIAHFTEGTVIELSNGRYEIAEACAGLRFLIATVALGVLFSHVVYTKWYKIGGFLIATVVVPLIANGFRCVGIITLAHYTDNQVAAGADHLIYGWFFNMLILLVLFFVGLRFRDPLMKSMPVSQGPAAILSSMQSRLSLLYAALGVAIAISAGPAFAYWHENRPIAADAAALSRPLQLDGWGMLADEGPWRPEYTGVDHEFFARFASGTHTVDVAIEYYARNREGRSLVAATNRLWEPERWREVRSGAAEARIGQQTVRFKETVIGGNNVRRLVWSSYWMDGRFTISGIAIKLLQLKTLLSGNESAALIAVSTPIDSTIEDARILLAGILASSPDITGRLNESANPRPARASLD